jgi:hypothetical protein
LRTSVSWLRCSRGTTGPDKDTPRGPESPRRLQAAAQEAAPMKSSVPEARRQPLPPGRFNPPVGAGSVIPGAETRAFPRLPAEIFGAGR